MLKRVIRIIFIIGVLLSTIGLVKVGYLKAKAHTAQYLMQSAWQKSQQSFNSSSIDNRHKPWPWADTWPIFELRIEKIGLSSLVLKDTSGESLAFGPGLLSSNYLPGDTGNSFIAAHRDTHFKDIGVLSKGDSILIQHKNGEQYSFTVDQHLVIDSRVENPIFDSAQPRITLITCYPFDAEAANTPHRYLVSAVLNEEL